MQTTWEERLRRYPPLRFGYLLVRRYLRHGVAIQGAALAFYLLFGLFPMLIFLSALLGILQLNEGTVLQTLGQVLPAEVVDLAGLYLRHVSRTSSGTLLVFGLVFSLWFPMRAVNSLIRAVRTAYRLGPPQRPVSHFCRTLLFTLLFISVMAVTLALITVSDRLLLWVTQRFALPMQIMTLWSRLRFPVIAAAGACLLLLLYALAQDTRQPWRNLWPGTLAALTAWLALSWGYAVYAASFADYSLLYGSIGSVMVVLTWLYLTAIVLILGAECNGTLMAMRQDGRSQDALYFPEKKR